MYVVSEIDLPMYCSVETMNAEFDASWIKLPDKIDFYLIFEFPQPWDRKIELSTHFPEELRDYFTSIRNKGIKFKYLCVNPLKDDPGKNQKDTTILFFKGDPEEFIQYSKTELVIPSIDLLVDSIKALVEQREEFYQKFEVESKHTREIFVCIHSERDQCCGVFGSEIYNKLKHLSNPIRTIRIWEASHMGGHRVSPTLMDMPSGRFWGYLDPKTIEFVLSEKGNHIQVMKHYRGRMGLDRYSQIVEKSIFEAKGWDWFQNLVKSEIINQTEKIVKIKITHKNESIKGFITAEINDIGTIYLPKSGCSKDTTLTKFSVTNIREELD